MMLPSRSRWCCLLSTAQVTRVLIWARDAPVHSIFSFLRAIPDMVIMTPGDENECRQMLYTG